MIAQWTRFRDEAASNRTAPTTAEIAINREGLAKQFLDVESDVRDLCRAVKLVSSVITDQLADPIGGAPATSDNGLEVQTFYIDAEMLRFAVDHAADLALAVLWLKARRGEMTNGPDAVSREVSLFDPSRRDSDRGLVAPYSPRRRRIHP